MSFLRLTPSLDANGNLVKVNDLIQFRLALWHEGVEKEHLTVVSGGLGRQEKKHLRRYDDAASVPGSLEPIPEGFYSVGNYEFARANDYSASWGPGLGPVWFELTPQTPGGRRGDFGIHLDENASFSPGSAGCVVAKSLTDLRTIIEWQKAYKFDQLMVDYKLGLIQAPKTVSKPAVPKKPTSVPFNLDCNANGLTITFMADVKAGESYQLFSNVPSWTGKLVPQK